MVGIAAVRSVRKWLLVSLVLVSSFAVSPQAWAQQARGAVHLWDTMAPLGEKADLASRGKWRALAPEAANGLQGDLVVETNGLMSAFAAHLGKVLVYGGPQAQGQAAVVPNELLKKQATIAATAVAEYKGVVVVEATFRGPGVGDLPIAFWFNGDRVVAMRPEGNTRGIGIAAPVDLAVVPSIVGDDLIYDPRSYPSARALFVPSEHMLLGLLKGEGSMLVTTWQEAMPTVRLEVSGPGQKSITAISFVGGKDVCLAMLDAPGIWHREVLTPSFLERDVALQWKPPYQARWLTQLYEDELKTTFEFWHEKGEHWRGGIGSYTFPTWFSRGTAMLSLGKQIVPEGEAIIYSLERDEGTPEQVDTPMSIAERTLSADVRAGVLDVEARPTWWPMRPDAVLGGETCNVTDELKTVFEAGQEVEKQAIVRAGAEDMIFHLEVMFERNGRYYPFATNMISYLDAQAKAKPELTSYLRPLRATAQQMVTTYDNTRDTLMSMKYAQELGEKMVALAAEKRPDNVQRFLDLKQGWCGMGGAHEELSRRENTFARKLYQQAAYLAAANSKAIPIAEEVRKRTKQCLSRPDSYEIWEQN